MKKIRIIGSIIYMIGCIGFMLFTIHIGRDFGNKAQIYAAMVGFSGIFMAHGHNFMCKK